MSSTYVDAVRWARPFDFINVEIRQLFDFINFEIRLICGVVLHGVMECWGCALSHTTAVRHRSTDVKNPKKSRYSLVHIPVRYLLDVTSKSCWPMSHADRHVPR